MLLIYPGSFDPVTAGHIDIARRGARLAARLIVAVLDNPGKKTLFSPGERVAFLRGAFPAGENIEVEAFSGLLAEYVRLRGANAILRGLRSPGDFESERRYAAYNQALSGGVDTVFLPASPPLSHISSGIVREAAAHIYAGALDDSVIRAMVPQAVCAALEERLR